MLLRARCVRLQSTALPVRLRSRNVAVARPLPRPSLLIFSQRRSFQTTTVARRSTATPEPAAAVPDPAAKAPPPNAKPADAPAAEAAAETPAAEAAAGEQPASEGGAQAEAPAEGEAAAGDAAGAAGDEDAQRETYFRKAVEREEQQAWENIEKFQRRVAAHHELQKQVLLKLIREVNELEEQDAVEEREQQEYFASMASELKEVVRHTEKQKPRQ